LVLEMMKLLISLEIVAKPLVRVGGWQAHVPIHVQTSFSSPLKFPISAPFQPLGYQTYHKLGVVLNTSLDRCSRVKNSRSSVIDQLQYYGRAYHC
jgi:hypothetical protein